jgi:hypothetical protein
MSLMKQLYRTKIRRFFLINFTFFFPGRHIFFFPAKLSIPIATYTKVSHNFFGDRAKKIKREAQANLSHYLPLVLIPRGTD